MTVYWSLACDHPFVYMQVRVEEDDVIIKADKNALENTRRTKGSVLAAFDEDKRTFLIVGGGKERWRGERGKRALRKCTSFSILSVEVQ